MPRRLGGSRAVIRGGPRWRSGPGWGSGRGQEPLGPWEAGRRAQEAGLKEGTCSGGGAIQQVVLAVVGGASRGSWRRALGLGGWATAEGGGAMASMREESDFGAKFLWAGHRGLPGERSVRPRAR